MAKPEKVKKQKVSNKEDSLWREPITLGSLDDDDPLAALYQGREVSNRAPSKTGKSAQKRKTTTPKPAVNKTRNSGKPNKKETVKNKKGNSTKMSEEALKEILKIESDSFNFTDIREILRGKSLEIYSYLSLLAGDTGTCQIKHLDLMNAIGISRPTLFKQSSWLIHLSLIEKSSVPGNHLGTSYRVYRIGDALSISKTLVEQLDSHIKSQESKTK